MNEALGGINRKALTFWQQVIGESLAPHEADLSTRQMAILLHVYLHPGPHTIKTLSATLGISKPAICRAVDMLSIQNCVKRRRDEQDKRIVYIDRTEQGGLYLTGFSRSITRALASFA